MKTQMSPRSSLPPTGWKSPGGVLSEPAAEVIVHSSSNRRPTKVFGDVRHGVRPPSATSANTPVASSCGTRYPSRNVSGKAPTTPPVRKGGIVTASATVHNQRGDLVLSGHHKYLLRFSDT
jgi:hypothetical protein